ncbi:hypothetical protein TVAG_182140 [Trichomonas vaginalis G3]|uniref:Uncharacterized protein n=1 Tax=Trichomonas vaginalis (strain ATCC PRA-98 / G3) TaxID=412133 RepID=A2D8V2_TRIV3|nr:hypothetical protein TVAGG3_0528400 [Trichomonas vaginalis G3]EAY22978.1 hypothetical protein TVAG_182140 [Trichomonas vaginalis G3]KAI5518941.1 hypothetical protein TVAGG3_0528400 [Trichomonas vaginalis G3]|eukprot:XP_001583964.1 hypothetical protein [Trichomonas vaginalis G3]
MFLLFLLFVAFRRARNPYMDPEHEEAHREVKEETTDSQPDDCEDVKEPHKGIIIKSVFKLGAGLIVPQI